MKYKNLYRDLVTPVSREILDDAFENNKIEKKKST